MGDSPCPYCWSEKAPAVQVVVPGWAWAVFFVLLFPLMISAVALCMDAFDEKGALVGVVCLLTMPTGAFVLAAAPVLFTKKTVRRCADCWMRLN